eukprot:776114-Rhodomonas_salina.1
MVRAGRMRQTAPGKPSRSQRLQNSSRFSSLPSPRASSMPLLLPSSLLLSSILAEAREEEERASGG